MGLDQTGAAQEGGEGGVGRLEGGGNERGAGDQEQVQTRREVRQEALHGGAQESFGAIPSDGPANGLSGGDSDSHVWLVAGLGNQHNKRVGIRLSKTPHPLEIG